MILRRHLAAAAVAFIAAACASRPPAAAPPIVEEEEPVWVLQDVSANHSTWLDLPASIRGKIGGPTHIRSAWYRFNLQQTGKLEVSLSLQNGDAVGVNIYDSSVVHGRDDVRQFGGDIVTTEPKTITLAAAPSLYYVEVFCDSGAALTEYALAVFFERDVAPPPSPSTRTNRRRDGPESPATSVTPSPRVPVPSPAPTPSPTVTMPVEQPIDAAQPLPRDGSVRVTLGAGQPTFARWYVVDTEAPSVITWRLRARSGDVAMRIQDSNGQTLREVETSGETTVALPVTAGRYYARIETAPSEMADVMLGASVAPQLREPARSSVAAIGAGRSTIIIGGDTGLRWSWHRLAINRKSYVRIEATSDGNAVTISAYKSKTGEVLGERTIHTSGALELRPEEAIDIRVALAGGHARSRVTLDITVNASRGGHEPRRLPR